MPVLEALLLPVRVTDLSLLTYTEPFTALAVKVGVETWIGSPAAQPAPMPVLPPAIRVTEPLRALITGLPAELSMFPEAAVRLTLLFVELMLAPRLTEPLVVPAATLTKLLAEIIEFTFTLPLVPALMVTVLPEELRPLAPPMVTLPSPAAAELLLTVTGPVALMLLAIRFPPLLTVRSSLPALVPTEVALKVPLPALSATLPLALTVFAVREPVLVDTEKSAPLPATVPII